MGCRGRRGTRHVSRHLPLSTLHPSPALTQHSGASVARRFAKTYSVALLARNPANYEPLVKEINDAGGKAIGISTDCADGQAVKAAFDQIKKEVGSGKVAAAIYNVGGRFIRKPFLELSEDEFESGWVANGFVPPDLLGW